jgi:hypothetical protein
LAVSRANRGKLNGAAFKRSEFGWADTGLVTGLKGVGRFPGRYTPRVHL